MATFLVLSVTSSTVFEEYSTTGAGYPRLFEGAGGTYIYALSQRLVVTTDNWGSTNEIFPSASSLSIQAIAQILGESTNYTSVVFTATTTRYQSTPETAGGWSTGGSLVTGFRPIDAVGDDTGIWGVLVGNSSTSSTVKVMRSTTPPFTWTESDTGLPQGGQGITDLEVAQ